MNNVFKLFFTGLLTAILCFSFNMSSVKAATGTFSITAPSTATVGDTITFTIKATASKIFYWQFYVSYSSSKLKLTSGSTTIQGEADDATNGTSSVTRILKFKVINDGKATITVAQGEADMNIDTNFNSISYTTRSKTITLSDPIPKSTNNNLASLAIEGATLTPVFAAGTTSYSAEMAAGTTEINVSATVADSKAAVSGIGKVAVVEGDNTVNVVVTAENGSTKTYAINVSVKEYDPVEVKIDGKTYAVVRKKGIYTVPDNFKETAVVIDKETVLAYTNAKVGTIIGLKNEAGKIGLYLYNAKKKTYVLMTPVVFGEITYFIYKPTDIDVPNGYNEKTVKMDDISIKGWQLEDTKDVNFYLLYALNTDTGNKNFYQYDKKENVFQRYNENVINESEKSISNYLLMLGASIFLLVVAIGVNVFQFTKFNKIQQKIKKAREKKLMNEKKTVD